MANLRSSVSYEAGGETTSLLSHVNDTSTEITSVSSVKKKTTNYQRNVVDTNPSSCKRTSNVKHASKGRMAVTLASCFYLILSASAVHISLGIIYVELVAYFDSPRSDAALVQSVYGGVSVGGGILFTNLVLKYEIGLVIMLASLITTASFCASAFAPNIGMVIILIGVIAGLANSINFLSSYIVVSWMFQERRKAAMVVLLIGSALGQIVIPYITTALIERLFWSNTVIIIGALMFLNNVPCGLIIYFSREYFQKGDDSKRERSRLVDVKCLTDVAFMLFLSSHIFLSTLISVESFFVVDLSKLKGYSAEASATLLSVNGLSLFLSRIIGVVWLALAPNTKLVWHLTYMFLVLALSHILVSQFGEYWIMLLGIMLRGLSGGLMYAFVPGVQMDMRGLELFPQTVSICNFLGGVASIAGGYIGGLSYDLTGSYSVIFFAASGTNVFNAVSMVLIIIIQTYRRTRRDGYDKLRDTKC